MTSTQDMSLGEVVHTEVGTSGTTYTVRRNYLPTGGVAFDVTIGPEDDYFVVGTLGESDLDDISYFIDGLDEETRCLLAEARIEFGF